jgi:hypothetical protein
MPRKQRRLRLVGSWLFFLAVCLEEFSVRVDLESPFFPLRSDDDFIVPLAVGVVFPFHPNNLSASRLLVGCLLNGGGERLHLNHFPGLFSCLRSHATSETGADHCC